MEELIKRLERVIQTGVPDKDGMHPISAETVLEVVKELPPIQPDIVRCKDCKHFESEYGYCDYYQWNMTGGDFCSKAERREAKT